MWPPSTYRLPIGYRGRGDAHHHGDLVQPEPMAAIGKPQREPHRILGVLVQIEPFYRGWVASPGFSLA